MKGNKMPFNIKTVIEELKSKATDEQKQALNILEGRFYECITLRKQLSLAVETMGQIAQLSDNKVDAVQCENAIRVIDEMD